MKGRDRIIAQIDYERARKADLLERERKKANMRRVRLYCHTRGNKRKESDAEIAAYLARVPQTPEY